MSVPETNARPPAPRRTRTRIPSSASTSSQRSWSASYIAKVIALRACGRLKVMTAVDPRRSKSRSSSAMCAEAGGRRQTEAPAAWQSGQMPQNVTSASSITKSAVSPGVRHGAAPTTQSTSCVTPHDRHTRWWWLSPTRVS